MNRMESSKRCPDLIQSKDVEKQKLAGEYQNGHVALAFVMLFVLAENQASAASIESSKPDEALHLNSAGSAAPPLWPPSLFNSLSYPAESISRKRDGRKQSPFDLLGKDNRPAVANPNMIFATNSRKDEASDNTSIVQSNPVPRSASTDRKNSFSNNLARQSRQVPKILDKDLHLVASTLFVEGLNLTGAQVDIRASTLEGNSRTDRSLGQVPSPLFLFGKPTKAPTLKHVDDSRSQMEVTNIRPVRKIENQGEPARKLEQRIDPFRLIRRDSVPHEEKEGSHEEEEGSHEEEEGSHEEEEGSHEVEETRDNVSAHHARSAEKTPAPCWGTPSLNSVTSLEKKEGILPPIQVS